ncbi:CAF17-like 4Fe-4S cluster assembly/insertion protein YgfZ [Labrys wisconsinensis]|uniref:Folate-binding protein YgfZ n=1 Tax=Labrys wisconsinensis TaxID=425677 RepID=A0ABU0J8F2_9HYPH|nr:folate-binding protein [Labrys wisconsinensis]MDQ0470556.1 folate-binding protein YgfZ [Labrys wisconsinensis]
MPTAFLPDRGVIRITGEDALPWLQNIVTSDMSGLKAGEARYGALLTPQGKILYDFIASFGRIAVYPDQPEGVHLDVPRSLAADFARRLAFYKLRAKVRVEDLSSEDPARERIGVVAALPGDFVRQEGALTYADPRHPGLGQRGLMPEHDALAVSDGEPDDYHARRIALGIPEGGRDFAYGDTFPHEALMDMLGGVDFHKGCYVGQEVVSRMQHRGTARTRIVPTTFVGEAPAAGTEVRAGEKGLGAMGSSAKGRGLAMLRLDRAEEAIAAGAPLLAGETALSLVKPDWWKATWPHLG